MPKSKKRKKQRPSRVARPAGERRCPDFDLAELRAYRRDVLLPRADDDQRTKLLKGFTVALALGFNDIKDVSWVNEQLKKGKPEGQPAVDAYRGQWMGMNGAFGRYNAGFMTEMGHCIAAARRLGLLDMPAFKAAEEKAARSAPRAVPAWKQLVVAFTATGDDRGLVDPVARFLMHVRNNSFHYGHRDNFRALLSGYSDRFRAEVNPDGSNESAFASLGETQEGTRFYFADAAIIAFTESKMNACGVTGPALGTFAKALGLALRYILEALLEHFEAAAPDGAAIGGAGS